MLFIDTIKFSQGIKTRKTYIQEFEEMGNKIKVDEAILFTVMKAK